MRVPAEGLPPGCSFRSEGRVPGDTVRLLGAAGILALLLIAAAASAATQVQVRIEGISGELKANVLASLSIARYRNFGVDPQATIRRLNGRARREIRDALEPFGYFSPSVESTLDHSGKQWTATYRISPGPVITVRRVSVTVDGPGANDPAFQAIEREPPIRPGQPLRQQRYTDTKRALQEVAAERGYFDARFVAHSLTVDPAALSAEVLLVYATGPRYRFGPVVIHQDILDPRFVRRFVHIRPGEPYDATALARLQAALAASNYFSSVSVIPERAKARDLRVPIEVETTPGKRNRYFAGVGYGTDTGPRLRLGWENRRINRRGHRFRLDATLSRIETQATAQYIVPLQNPANERLVLSATDNQENYGGTVGHFLGFGASRITQVGGWQRDEYLNIGRYTSDIGGTSLRSRLLAPGIGFSRISARITTYSQFGYSVFADVHGTAKALGSDNTFLRADVNARVAIPLGRGQVLLRGELGAIIASDFQDLPVAERFFAGGDASVRGYAYQSIGPRNSQGIVVGGRYLEVGSFEYDYPVVGHWGIAGFFDAGTARDSPGGPLDEGIGVGARYYTPVGAIRIDLAHPIAHPELGFYRIHISIGLAL